MTVHLDDTIGTVDWARAKADLAADDFDNGRSPDALRRSFEASAHVVFARADAEDADGGGGVVGMARLLSDGVCNSYLLDVWTRSDHRRRGVATSMVRALLAAVPGQHVGLQTGDAEAFYRTLGFAPQPQFLSMVVGTWLEPRRPRS